jgi:hypothetical protein
MVEDSEARRREDPWLHMRIFQTYIESKFIPKNYDYISKCKFCDLTNMTNDNLHQYVRA